MHTPTHGGDRRAAALRCGCAPADFLDASANINPMGSPPGLLEAAAQALADVAHYPSPRAEPLRSLLAEKLGVPVVVGNGANELLFAACAGMESAYVGGPAYGGYLEAAQAAGARLENDPALAAVRFWGRPNNPDGDLPSVAEVWRWCEQHPTQRVVVDESFVALTDSPSCSAPNAPENLLVVTSMTKTYAIPGLRLGYAAGARAGELADRIPMWSVNGPALAAGLVAFSSGDWLDQARVQISHWRGQQLQAWMSLPGVVSVAGAANYILIELALPMGPLLCQELEREHRILVRDCSNYTGLGRSHVRVAVPDAAKFKV
ncbi:MAG: histidinol-phosphate/aromatic aminotransferase/cobyric acid decarboxylase-like protein, partial [Cognaticolwellia sp.]